MIPERMSKTYNSRLDPNSLTDDKWNCDPTEKFLLDWGSCTGGNP
jgi:hypothetical protein